MPLRSPLGMMVPGVDPHRYPDRMAQLEGLAGNPRKGTRVVDQLTQHAGTAFRRFVQED